MVHHKKGEKKFCCLLKPFCVTMQQENENKIVGISDITAANIPICVKPLYRLCELFSTAGCLQICNLGKGNTGSTGKHGDIDSQNGPYRLAKRQQTAGGTPCFRLSGWRHAVSLAIKHLRKMRRQPVINIKTLSKKRTEESQAMVATCQQR